MNKPTEEQLHAAMHQVAARYQKPDRNVVESLTRAMSYVALMLNEMSLNADIPQCDANALKAGALMLASQSDELLAGGETDASADFYDRAVTAVVSAYTERMHQVARSPRINLKKTQK